MKNARLAAVLAVVGFAFLSFADAQETLKLKYPPGTYVTTMKMDMDASTTLDDQDMPGQKSSMTMVMEMTYGKPDADGKQEIAIKYTKVKQSTTAGGKEMAYDSEGPADKQDSNLAGMFKPMLDAKIVAVLDAQGKVESVKGLDSMFDDMAKSNPASAGMTGEMKKSMGDESIKQMFDMPRKLLPDKPVSEGDKYDAKVDITVPFLGKLAIAYEGKIESIKDNVATISLTGKGGNDKPTTTQMGPAKMDINKMKIDQTMQQKFDIKKGMATQQDTTQTMSMEMGMKVGEESKTMKITQKMTMTTTTVPK